MVVDKRFMDLNRVWRGEFNRLLSSGKRDGLYELIKRYSSDGSWIYTSAPLIRQQVPSRTEHSGTSEGFRFTNSWQISTIVQDYFYGEEFRIDYPTINDFKETLIVRFAPDVVNLANEKGVKL